jgi:integrase
VGEYVEGRAGKNPGDLCFPGAHGHHQPYNNYLRRGWHVLMEAAGLVEGKKVRREAILKPLYAPCSLRHFYASMLIAKKVDLKTIQERTGHQDAAMTLNVYGHLIRQKQAESGAVGGILSDIIAA